MRKKKAKSKKVKKTSRRKTSKPAEKIFLMEMDSECFNEVEDPRGFQSSDLKEVYLQIYIDMLKAHQKSLLVEPTGNPGISLYLQPKN